ncbi:MAG: type I restriction enzyme M protein [Myxococcota bacterium]|jgi:type I restriction enzyme M protein
MARRLNSRPTSVDGLLIRLEEQVLSHSGVDAFEAIFQLLIARLTAERLGKAFEQSTFAGLLTQAAERWPDLQVGAVPLLPPAVLGLCVRSLGGFVLDGESLPVLDALLERVTAPGAKGGKGQFFTPRNVTTLAASLVDIRPGDRVADPACGSGGFLLAARARQRESSLYGYDFDARTLRLARALLLFAGDADAHLEHADSLARTGQIPGGGFDVILTNPPFAGDVQDPALLQTYAVAGSAPRVERDVLFVERCVDLLAPGGRMAMVLPQNKLGGQRFAALRSWLVAQVEVVAVVGLEASTFLPHTHQKCGVLVVRRPMSGPPPADPEIFFAVSEASGKDRRGRTAGPDDFDAILTAFAGHQREAV